MGTTNIPIEYSSYFYNQAGPEIENLSGSPYFRPEVTGLQTYKDQHRPVTDKSVFNMSSVADLYFFPLDKAQRELNEIREEVEETCAVANDVEPIPESAYSETLSLLTRIHYNIPMPDMMWLEDGGIGLEWRPGNGIVTMSLYGDQHVTFVAILGNQHKIAGTCPLTDSRILPGFLATLPLFFRQRT